MRKRGTAGGADTTEMSVTIQELNMKLEEIVSNSRIEPNYFDHLASSQNNTYSYNTSKNNLTNNTK